MRWRMLAAGLAALLAAAPATASPESDFHDILNRTRAVYVPIAATYGQTLDIRGNWLSDDFVASADRKGKTVIVNVTGAFLRRPGATADLLRLVICHELGHLFGGAPRRPPRYEEPADTDDGLSFYASEGQADYYASLKCMRLVLEGDRNVDAAALLDVPPLVRRRCAEQFPQADDAAVCMRSATAGLTWTSLTGPKPVSFSTPSQESVTRTDNATYPSRQCRLDTIFAGALCAADKRTQTHPDDPLTGTCAEAGRGGRPACWFVQ